MTVKRAPIRLLTRQADAIVVGVPSARCPIETVGLNQPCRGSIF